MYLTSNLYTEYSNKKKTQNMGKGGFPGGSVEKDLAASAGAAGLGKEQLSLSVKTLGPALGPGSHSSGATQLEPALHKQRSLSNERPHLVAPAPRN